MSILNRWGETIFRTKNPNEGWCGTTQNHLRYVPTAYTLIE